MNGMETRQRSYLLLVLHLTIYETRDDMDTVSDPS